MNMLEINPSKYIIHKSGVPVRIPAHLRREITNGNPDSEMQIKMVREDPFIGERNPEDTIPMNLQENIRLRRIAKKIITPQLVAFAEEWNIDRYTVLVHGSLAKGLVRNPSGQDRSDIDIDLIINNPTISKQSRVMARERMRKSSKEAKVDSYVWDMDELRRTLGDYSRIYLRSAAYPTANKGDLWKEILWIGMESQRFLSLSNFARKKIRRIFPLLINGQLDQVLNSVNIQTVIGIEAHKYLKDMGLLDVDAEAAKQRAKKIYALVEPQNKNSDKLAYQCQDHQKQSIW